MLVLYLSNQRKQSGKIGRNFRYKTWFNYFATVNREALTRWDHTSQQVANQNSSMEQGKWPKYLCCQFQSDLGDQMFTFASSYGIAKEKHRILVSKINILPMFTLMADESVVERRDADEICSNVRRHQLVNRPGIKDLNLTDDFMVLNGYLHSWKYFQNVEMELRKMFTFRTDIIKEAQKILHDIKKEHIGNRPIPKNITFVGMYVQRSSIANPLKDFIVPPRSYFLKAMQLF